MNYNIYDLIPIHSQTTQHTTSTLYILTYEDLRWLIKSGLPKIGKTKRGDDEDKEETTSFPKKKQSKLYFQVTRFRLKLRKRRKTIMHDP